MTDARKALVDRLAREEPQSFWHPEIGGEPTIMVNVSLSTRERDLIVEALRPLPGTREEVARDVSAISDEDMRDLLSAKDVGTGRARLRRLLAALPPSPMPEREGMREAIIEECARAVADMRQREAGLTDSLHTGLAGASRSDALHDAYSAIRALSPDAAPTTMREALIECGDELYAAFIHQTETVTAGQADALRNFARASNCYRAALAPRRGR